MTFDKVKEVIMDTVGCDEEEITLEALVEGKTAVTAELTFAIDTASCYT